MQIPVLMVMNLFTVMNFMLCRVRMFFCLRMMMGMPVEMFAMPVIMFRALMSKKIVHVVIVVFVF